MPPILPTYLQAPLKRIASRAVIWHLAFLLWPDSTEAQTRINLRHLLHQLHQTWPAAGYFLCADAQAARWQSGAAFCLAAADTARVFGVCLIPFKQALRAMLAHAHD